MHGIDLSAKESVCSTQNMVIVCILFHQGILHRDSVTLNCLVISETYIFFLESMLSILNFLVLHFLVNTILCMYIDKVFSPLLPSPWSTYIYSFN